MKSEGILSIRYSLQENERLVLDLLAQSWNAYLQLSSLHPDQDLEFRLAIHSLQHQVMARPAKRMLLDEQRGLEK